MQVFWRVLFAVILIGGTTFWMQHAATTAAARPDADPAAVRAPAGDNGDNGDNGEADNGDNDNVDIHDNSNGEDNDNNDNDDTNENFNSNGNGNDNGTSGSSGGVPTDPTQSGISQSNGDLKIDLWLSLDHAVYNQQLGVVVTGSGAPIDQVWWSASGPGSGGDNPSSMGEQRFSCNGAQPCDHYWITVPRGVGEYIFTARVRDTSGREVETVRRVRVAENPW
jgi:hypothetical protein